MLGVALVATALGAVVAAPAGAAAEGNQIVEIRSVAEGRCLDFDRQPTESLLPSLNACSGAPTQLFERIVSASGGEYLRNTGDHRCLDGASWIAFRQSCDTAVPAQRFELAPDAAGTVKLKTGGKAVDTYHYGARGELSMQAPYAIPTQQWQVRQVGVAPKAELAAVVRLRSAGTFPKCVAESGATTALTNCDAPGREAFQRVDAGAGKVALRNTASGKCLSNRDYHEVTLTDCATDVRAQQWTLDGD